MNEKITYRLVLEGSSGHGSLPPPVDIVRLRGMSHWCKGHDIDRLDNLKKQT